jgi:uncharacterized membrane protein
MKMAFFSAVRRNAVPTVAHLEEPRIAVAVDLAVLHLRRAVPLNDHFIAIRI